MDKIPMTAAGFTQLEKTLRRLKAVERPEIIQAISEARAHGDLSENAEYHAAKEKQGWIEAHIKDIEGKLSCAKVIDPRDFIGSDTVKFSATVTVIDEETEVEKLFRIVGNDEADIAAGKIALSSPIARALIGKKVGDSVEVITPGGEKFYEIIKIDYVPVSVET